MSLPIRRYELDRTGKNKNNLVEGELHTLSTRKLRALAPKYGAFFKESIRVYDNVTNTPLTVGKDYICTELLKEATLQYGKEICCIVLITNERVSSTVRITYQVLGGAYTNSVDEMITLYETAMSDNRPVEWSNVLDKPYGYNPNLHSHILADVVGFEPLVDAIDRIGRSIVLSNVPAFEFLIERIETSIAGFEQKLRDILAEYYEQLEERYIYFTRKRKNDVKTILELDKVENLPVASDDDLEKIISNGGITDEIDTNKYITLRQLGEYVSMSIESATMEYSSLELLRDSTYAINIVTTNIPNGRILYWVIEHNGTNDKCFKETKGIASVHNGRATINLTTTLEYIEGDALFTIKLTKKENGSGRVYDTSPYLKYSNAISDRLITYATEQQLFVNPLTAESMFVIFSLDDYSDTRYVSDINYKRFYSAAPEEIVQIDFFHKWLFEKANPETMFFDLTEGHFDYTRSL